jgi:hypothetical protein
MMIRFGTMIIKVLLVVISNDASNRKRQAQLFGALEQTATWYRGLVPMPVWWTYFSGTAGVLLPNVMAYMYLVSKSKRIATATRDTVRQWKGFITRQIVCVSQ